MEQEQTLQASLSQDFIQRRNQKNKIVLAIILAFVAVVWGITLLKMQ